MSQDLVSILVGVYNKEEYLQETLNSLDRSITKNEFNIELVFIDDNSTDKSFNIIQKYRWSNTAVKGIIVRKNESNLGPSDTLNIALDNSSGGYIVPMDADDLVTRLGIYKRYSAIRDNNDFSWVSGNEIIANTSMQVIAGKEFVTKSLVDNTNHEEVLAKFLTNELTFGPHTLMIRRNALNNPGWFPGIRSMQDTVLLLDLLSRQKKCLFIDDYVAIYRFHKYSAVRSVYNESLKNGDMIKTIEIISNYWSKYKLLKESEINTFKQTRLRNLSRISVQMSK